MEITLNGNELTTIKKLHQDLKVKLALPEYYGENLDALWDCLIGWIDLPTTIHWEHYRESQIFLGEYAERTVELLKYAQSEVEGFKIVVIYWYCLKSSYGEKLRTLNILYK